MKPKEQIQEIRKLETAVRTIKDFDILTFQYVICAIDKQIPKKPNVEKVQSDDGNTYYHYSCPMCGTQVLNKYLMNFCPRCGHALDWGKDSGI